MTATSESPPAKSDPRAVLSWALFDWAAQPFFTLITTFVFAPYFAASLAATPAKGQALWGYATAAAGLGIALTAPRARVHCRRHRPAQALDPCLLRSLRDLLLGCSGRRPRAVRNTPS